MYNARGSCGLAVRRIFHISTKKIITIVVCCIVGWIVIGGIIIALAFGVGLKLKEAAPAIADRVKANIMEGIPSERASSQPVTDLSAAEYKILQDEMDLFNKEGLPNFERLRKGILLYWIRYKELPDATWVKEAGINFPGGEWDSTYFEHTGTAFVYRNLSSHDGSFITLARYNNNQKLIYEVDYMIRPDEGKSLSSCEPYDKIGLALCRELAAQNGWEDFSPGFGIFEPLP